MDESNPYAPTQNTTRGTNPRGERVPRVLLALGFILIGIASYLFFFSESFTFYTPYSSTSDWILSLPYGMDYSINSYIALSAMIGCLVIGLLLLLISTLMQLRSFRTRNN
jgi:ABC-type Fe3+ transport system permease subunit